MIELLEPKEVVIDGRVFILSKFTAIAGREIVCKYPLTALPKVSDYKLNEETMLKLMAFVAVPTGGTQLRLNSPQLVDNHTGGWETLMKIEKAMMEYNCSFFRDGRISTFFDDVVQNAPQWILKILTLFSQQLSKMEKPPSTN